MSSAAAGTAVGAALGLAGGLLSVDARLALASVAALSALPVAVLELRGRRVTPLQCNRETPQSWVHLGPLRWAALNGMTLGLGATSRLGFVLWYLVPAGSLLTGSAAAGAAIFGTFGTLRALGAVALIVATRWAPARDFQRVTDWLILDAAPRARQGAAAVMLFTSAFALVALGL